jgi:malonate-semialdehyde dehydrogenase (acetylating) / methylmalonate-semialdehyde dehydrogenase
MQTLKNYINGKWVDSKSIETIDVVNPATGEVLAKVPYGRATALDVQQAAESGHKA